MNQQGLTEQELVDAGWGDKTQFISIVNNLLSRGRLKLEQVGGQYIYKAEDNRLVGLGEDHRRIYQLIEKSGDKGAWSKELQSESRLQQHAIAKITKELITRRLVKEVRPVTSKTKKVFMLYDIQPAREVSGGTWWQDGEFAASWVETLRGQCLNFIEENYQNPVSLQDIHARVRQTAGPSVPREEDIESIMRTLVLDESVHSRPTDSGPIYISRLRGNPKFDIFAGRLPTFMAPSHRNLPGLRVPCLSCALAEECEVGGRVCPEKCEYLTAWVRGGAADDQGDVRMNDW